MPQLAGKGKGVARMEIENVISMDLDLLNGKFSTNQDSSVVKVVSYHIRQPL